MCGIGHFTLAQRCADIQFSVPVVDFDNAEFNPICWHPRTVRAIRLLCDHPGPIAHCRRPDSEIASSRRPVLAG